jgi:uncharacterized protein YkwD
LLLVAAGTVSLRQGTQRAAAAGDCTADPALDSEEQLFLQLINSYRAQNGLQPLALSYTLTRAAQWKSNDLAANNYFTHDDLTRTWDQRIRDCGYGYNAWLGENIAAGNSGAQATFDQWRNSSGHNANMLGANYTAIGIARAYGATAAYGWYWTTDFGSVNDGWPGGAPAATSTPKPASTPTRTATATPTRTSTPKPASTPTRTATATPTRTSTPKPASTPTGTSTPKPASTPTLTATPAAKSIHVGDMDVAVSGMTSWRATVVITVHDASHHPVAGVFAVGTWSGGAVQWCLTGAAGTCTVKSPAYGVSVHSSVYALRGLGGTGVTYVPSANHDPDGNGTTITVTH